MILGVTPPMKGISLGVNSFSFMSIYGILPVVPIFWLKLLESSVVELKSTKVCNVMLIGLGPPTEIMRMREISSS